MNDKNKVRVCFPFVGDSIGGSHLSSIELIKALDKSKFDIKLLVHKKGVLSKHLVSEGIKPIFLEVKNFVGQKKGIIINFLNILINIFRLTSFINKNNIDIIHLNDASAGLTWVIPSKLSKAKIVWHQRVVFPNWMLYKTLSFFSEKIVCISDFVYKSLPNFNKKKSEKIFNPVSINKTKKNILQNKDLKNKKIKKILFLANIIETKRVDLFIKIAHPISKILPNSKFFIVGSDKKKILSSNLSKSIIYVGYSKYKEQWLKNCDLLIVTSENEGFNRTIVEGMLSKIPVIAVDSGAHKEIIKDKFNGWLVEKNNLNELINVSIKILGLKKNNLKKTIERAEKYAKEKFNVQKHASYISKIYLNLTKL